LRVVTLRSFSSSSFLVFSPPPLPLAILLRQNMRFLTTLISLAAMATDLGAAAPTFTPARPPAVPLAVRSPYLNAWLQGGSGAILPGSWPRHWT
jgi:hypothetical protein